MSIAEKEQEIVEEFSMLDGDMEMTINYIMELGEQLPDMPVDKKNDDHIVKGCQSKVWMAASANEAGQVIFQADSNTAVTKGLVSLLVRVLSKEAPEAILNTEITFPQQIGMNRFIGTQRSNGFGAMIKQMKLYALALSSKTQTDA
ncbi:MAG: SufE family protein [Marinoscillum sp.]|uniref:SufE family protein n=1 Tax=Marinoscillum sp. TaxID=2024838 RepID=UPI0032F7469C